MEAEKVTPIESARRGVVVFLDRAMDSEIAHFLLGQVLKRVKEFSRQYDTDADGGELARAVEKDFAADRQTFLICVFVKDGRVVGHLLAKEDLYYGRKFVYVHQHNLDRHAGISKEQELSALKHVEGWAKALGASGLRAAAPSEAHVRRLRDYGFNSFLTVVRKDFYV